MQERPYIVGLGGSLATPSTSFAALRLALEGADAEGASSDVFSVRELALPLYEPGAPVPEAVEKLCDAVERSQGMIWSSPLYHGSVSGAFKNSVDWMQHLAERDVPYLSGKVVGLVATAGGVLGLNAINSMEFSVRALRGYAVPMVLPIAQASQVFNDEGHVTDEAVGQQLARLGAEVCRAARQVSATGTCDYAEPQVAQGHASLRARAGAEHA